jgi:intracellular sulfur oxidation DsrE/DsrF family protein
MSADRTISDEHLNAFVDGQLDADEKSRILGALNADDELSRRACEFRRLRELVQHAYDIPPPPPRRQRLGSRASGLRQAVAAALLLAVGGGAGWVAGHAQQQSPLNLRAMYLDEEKAFQTAALDQAPVRGERKIVLHISSDAPDKLETALDTAEQLLATYGQLGQPLELELVANAGGLNLLRADVSPYAERVRELQRQYDNLTFLACRTAMDRLQREKRMSPDLLPEALITPNALDEILTRLQQGWMYISV